MGELRIRKRGDKWQYSFEGAPVDGKRTTISKSGYKTKTEAATEGTAALQRYNQGGLVIGANNMSYADYLDLWMDAYCKVELRPNTILNYTKKINNLIKPRLGKYKLVSINPITLQKFINDLFNECYSRNTISVVKGVISKSLDYAVTPLRYIPSSPAIYLKMPSPRAEGNKKLRKNPHVYLTPEQMQMVFQRFPEGTSSYLPLLIGYKCGLRIAEAFALTWSDIDFEKRTLSVNRQVQWAEKNKGTGAPSCWYLSDPKYDSFRTIELSSDVIEALRRAKERQQGAKQFHRENYIKYYMDENSILNTEGRGKDIDLIMRRDDGSYINSRNLQHVSEIARFELGLEKFDYHSLRHTHTTMLLENGADPSYVQHRLGHKDVTVTLKVYKHLTEKMTERGVEVLESL